MSGTAASDALPPGFRYRPDFITAAEEQELTAKLGAIEFTNFSMRGFVARRRVAFFGRSYDAGEARIRPIPAFLLPLRERIAAWAGVAPDAFVMALVNEYRPGAPIGWHRDAPQYALVAGVSLLSACRMKFRPYIAAVPSGAARSRRTATHELVLEPRSAYLMTGESRSNYEHHIPAGEALRYSITFRTARPERRTFAA